MVIIQIRSETDVFSARRAGREMALQMGFGSPEAFQIEITISELATNILKYGIRGTIRLVPGEQGLDIVSEDAGPGLESLEAARTGRGADRTGLGIGLAGVKRLMDAVEFERLPGNGTRIFARKWKTSSPLSGHRCPRLSLPEKGLLRYGAVSIPKQQRAANGDAVLIQETGRQALIALVDGLGHGQNACLAARQAIKAIKAHSDRPLPVILEHCHAALRRTRGAVLSLARIDLEQAVITCAGVGNVRTRILGPEKKTPLAAPGIIGRRVEKVQEESFPFDRRDLLFMYSDGISKEFDPASFVPARDDLQKAAEDIARTFGNDQDDATILMAREG